MEQDRHSGVCWLFGEGMNDFVTFYYPPNRRGETLFLELASPSGASQAVFYASGSLQASLGLKSNRFADADSYQRARSAAARLVKEQGGLMVEWSGGRYRVGLFPASSYKPPSTLLLLSPYGEPRAVALENGREAARDTSQRLVVPVDQGAESRLQSLLGQLSGFPDDVQSVLFSALRRPAMEARLSRLEDRLAGSSAVGKHSSRRAAERSPQTILQPWMIAPALVTLIFLIGMIGIYWANRGLEGFSPVPFLSSSSESSLPEPQGPEGTQPPAATGSQAGTGETAANPSEGDSAEEGTPTRPPQPPPSPALLTVPDAGLKDPLEKLLAAWAQADAATPAGKVYQSHLAPARAAHPADPDAALAEESAAWGLAKLHWLAAAGQTLPEPSLTRTDHRSALKSRLQRTGLPEALQPSFAYFGCLAFGQPGLKEYPGDTVAGAYLLEGAACQSIDRQGTLTALEQLTAFVQPQSGQ